MCYFVNLRWSAELSDCDYLTVLPACSVGHWGSPAASPFVRNLHTCTSESVLTKPNTCGMLQAWDIVQKRAQAVDIMQECRSYRYTLSAHGSSVLAVGHGHAHEDIWISRCFRYLEISVHRIQTHRYTDAQLQSLSTELSAQDR